MVPRGADYRALGWQAAGAFEVDLVRARFFVKDYPLYGQKLAIDSLGPATPNSERAEPAAIRQELGRLGATCVAADPYDLTAAHRRRLEALLGRATEEHGLLNWRLPRR